MKLKRNEKAVIVSVGCLFAFAFLLYPCYPDFAKFLMDFLVSFGALSAVVVALMIAILGDYLREQRNPIELVIEVPELETIINAIGGRQCQCHHLRVRNKTTHRTVEHCRVWLEKVKVKQPNGEWEEIVKFAVPRLMEWAPSEYSRDQRTFCATQVFDLGKTWQLGGGFELTFERDQGGNSQKSSPVGTICKILLYPTADNYPTEKRFAFQIEVPPFGGSNVTPAIVTPCDW